MSGTLPWSLLRVEGSGAEGLARTSAGVLDCEIDHALDEFIIRKAMRARGHRHQTGGREAGHGIHFETIRHAVARGPEIGARDAGATPHLRRTNAQLTHTPPP